MFSISVNELLFEVFAFCVRGGVAISQSRLASFMTAVASATLHFIQDILLLLSSIQLDTIPWLLGEIALLSGLSYAMYYVFFLIELPRLYFVPTPLNERLIDHMPSLRQRFWPTVWLPSLGLGHLQTMFTVCRRDDPCIVYERSRFIFQTSLIALVSSFFLLAASSCPSCQARPSTWPVRSVSTGL